MGMVLWNTWNLPAKKKIQVWSLGWEDPLEKGMATHSKILAWRIPRTEESGRLQSMELQSQTGLSDQHFHFPGAMKKTKQNCVVISGWGSGKPPGGADFEPRPGLDRPGHRPWRGMTCPRPRRWWSLWSRFGSHREGVPNIESSVLQCRADLALAFCPLIWAITPSSSLSPWSQEHHSVGSTEPHASCILKANCGSWRIVGPLQVGFEWLSGEGILQCVSFTSYQAMRVLEKTVHFI